MSLKKHIRDAPQTGISDRIHTALTLYTCEFYPNFGGITTYCDELARSADRAGYNTTLRAPRDAVLPSNQEINYTFSREKWAANHDPTTLVRVHREIKKELARVDEFHILAEPGPILALGAVRLERSGDRTIILVFHGSEVIRWSKNPITRKLARRAIRLADRIVCVSGPVKQKASELFPESNEKLVIVPNALPSRFKEQSTATIPPRRIDGEKFRLLSVGRFHPRKGFDHIIKAIGTLPADTRSRIHYQIVGGLKSQKYLSDLKLLAAASRVSFTYETDATSADLDSAYRAADAFALTSIAHKSSIEGFGIVYLEAGAHGLPCLAYDSGGVRDAVQHRETGYLCETGSIHALAERIDEWVKFPETARSMGEANRRFALSRSWDHVLREIISK